ncbi:MAG: DUF4870 domain-containing protein [Bacteroidales bacterium]
MEYVDQNLKDERMWGMFCHLSAFAGYIVPFGSIIGPLVVWVLKKNESVFVDEQGKEALNFQITITLFKLLSIPFWLVFIGILIFAALVIFNIIMVIIASIKANNGESFRYPLSIRFIK